MGQKTHMSAEIEERNLPPAQLIYKKRLSLLVFIQIATSITLCTVYFFNSKIQYLVGGLATLLYVIIRFSINPYWKLEFSENGIRLTNPLFFRKRDKYYPKNNIKEIALQNSSTMASLSIIPEVVFHLSSNSMESEKFPLSCYMPLWNTQVFKARRKIALFCQTYYGISAHFT
ncbi:MAG: hypothetical protein ACTSYI_10600 [Promethearchaeota archaeon]